MFTFQVSSSRSLLSELVAALVREHFPAADIRFEHESQLPAGAIVSLAGGSRWLYLSTAAGSSPDMAQALADGASAVLSIDSSGVALAHALTCLTSGSGTYVPLELLHWMANEVLGKATPKSTLNQATRLTQRERNVLELVARGCSNFEIARELTISENTVRSHLHALSVKFGASSRAKMLANARAARVPEAFEPYGAAAARRTNDALATA
jgi:DNA-binding NarL/FixJ family response regulator